MLLAIDTATDTASLALFQDNQVVAELTWCCGQNHSVELLPQLVHLLVRAKLELKSVSGIVVGRGPGSFNGLRVGVSTAKGLAVGLGIPIIGINTLEAAAYQHAETALPVCPIFNAGRGEIAAAVYQQTDNKWLTLATEYITTLDALCSRISGRTVFCGELVSIIGGQLRQKLGQNAVIPSPAARLRRAAFLAELGQRQLEAGNSDNPATLQPIYLRRPPITKPKHL